MSWIYVVHTTTYYNSTVAGYTVRDDHSLRLGPSLVLLGMQAETNIANPGKSALLALEVGGQAAPGSKILARGGQKPEINNPRSWRVSLFSGPF